jgi:hypothetical protein
MPNMTRRLTPGALALIAAFASAPLLAEQDRWFRVELLVFANETTEQPQGASIAEQWDATPTLAYPLASRFLVDSKRVAENAAEFSGESLVDKYGRQIIKPLTGGGLTVTRVPNDATKLDAVQSAPVPVPPTPVYQGIPPSGIPPSGVPPAGVQPTGSAPANNVPAIAKSMVLPRPFVLLPGDYQEFRGKAALMQRGGRYSVLFHETWVQPVGSEKRSLPIVLDRSGDTQQWSRLQGTINLFVSRYLHVQTNLWLNTSGAYIAGTWQMPAPPLGPPSLIIEEQELVDIAAAIDELPASAMSGAEEATDVLEMTGSGEEIVEVETPVYPYRHAVLLEQTRRMRSNETHYIDHPLMGVIIKFTPITAEELSAIAAKQ